MTYRIREILAYGLVFFLLTSITIFWTRFSGGLALVWPGTAIATALLLRRSPSRWMGPTLLFVALSAVATATFGFGPGPAIPLALVNLFEALLAATLMLILRPQRDYLDSGAGIAALVVAAGILAPAAASIPGGYLAAGEVGGQWYEHSASWLVGHGVGTVLVLPLMLLLATYRRSNFARLRDPGRISGFLAIAGLTLAASTLAIFQQAYPLLFLPFLPLLLASFWFGRLGATTGVLLVSLVASVSLGLETGVFAELDLPLAQKALFLQFYLTVLFVICLPMAVALKQRSRLMAEISEREALQRLIADHSDDALLHLDEAGRITFASPAFARLGGVPEPVGERFATMFGIQGTAPVEAALRRAALSVGRTEIHESLVTRDEAARWLEAKIQAVASASGKATSYVVTIRDVTSRKLDELQASREARTDALTGLPNRRAFLDRIEAQLGTADERPFALALIDLDHFKLVNDNYGHDTGDDVLQHVAAIMRGLTTPDCFFARLGGEEFGMIATGQAVDHAWRISEQLRLSIHCREMSDRNGRTFRVTASIGLAQIAENCKASAAMSMADEPLYEAKEAGRNCLRQASRTEKWTRRAGTGKPVAPLVVAR